MNQVLLVILHSTQYNSVVQHYYQPYYYLLKIDRMDEGQAVFEHLISWDLKTGVPQY